MSAPSLCLEKVNFQDSNAGWVGGIVRLRLAPNEQHLWHDHQMQVASVHVYPVKGCAGVQVDTWPVEPRGLSHDREFMVVDANGLFITQRKRPELAVVRPSFTDDGQLALVTPGGHVQLPLGDSGVATNTRRSVEVWGFRAVADDAGDAAAELLSDHLDQPVRLVRVPADYPRQADPETAGPGVPVSFSDGYPLLITTTASLEALNGWLDEPLPMNRFRPNLVIDGSTPFAEDNWRRIRVGDIDIDLVSPCTRCAVTTIDQEIGAREGPEPLRSLAMFRRGPDGVEFGWNAVPRTTGTISLRDVVVVSHHGEHDNPGAASAD